MVTRQLNEAGITIGIEVLDHVVVGDTDRYYSIREAGRMESGSMARAGAA